MFLKSTRHTGEKSGVIPAEPILHVENAEADFQRIKTGIHRELLDSLDLSRIAGLTEEELREDIRHLAEGMLRARSRKLPAIDEDRLVEELIAESFGLGPLETYMQDPDVTDILVNGPSEVYVERLGRLQETNTVFADNDHLLQIIQRVAARVGRRIDEHSPMVDARLADGSRVNAIIPPLALGGPVLSIRRFGHRPLQINDVLVRGSVCPEIMAVLEAAIEGRINLMISGGTGSGKTTMLNILSRYIPANERLVTIEDSAELNLQRKHVVKLETRPKSPEGASEVTQRDLVRNALRMRPDRIILGEVRGGEALDMLQAMNTGHEGSLTTIHANDTRDALSRLEVMVSMSGFDLPVNVVRRYIASAITVVVHLARLKGGARRVMKVSEITALENGEYTVQDLFGFQQTGVDERGIARGHFYATGNKPNFARRLAETGIDLNERLFTARKLTADSAIGPMSSAEGAQALALQENLA
ncbi:Putative conjugal transfer protein [Anatilimnocola aggregata]|uniref:Conjugal transfer protein n=1 Tax=Anatilimnocola aggregata TaxID=2528021 RepID=A0A517YLE5_9BACT|nr:CpaF family protein [Anatilimnocola aggregata]QDU31034.1 Putative conjugal transfer protein [Anatilimnocola aggregata]